MAFVREHLSALIADRDRQALSAYLAEHSNLPGPRGNLELARATADLLAHSDLVWVLQLIEAWGAVGLEEAGGDDPQVMLPFTAAQTAGALWQRSNPAQRKRLDTILRSSANDTRWRVREGAAMGLQRIGLGDFDALRTLLDDWAFDASPLEWRAIVAGLAEPALLSEPARADYGLDMSLCALEVLQGISATTRRQDAPRALRAALGYAISVFLAADASGFPRLEVIASISDKDARWIVQENLKKARIANRYPTECARVAAIAGR